MSDRQKKIQGLIGKLQYLPEYDSDPCLLILKTHLISEAILDAHLKKIFVHSRFVLNDYVKFSKKIDYLRSLSEKPDKLSIRVLIALNKLRNEYAHHVESDKIDEMTNSFIRLVRERLNGKQTEQISPPNYWPSEVSELYLCCRSFLFSFAADYGFLLTDKKGDLVLSQ